MSENCYVDKYKLRYSYSGEVWRTYLDANGAEKEFRGSRGYRDVSHNILDPPMNARHVQLAPIDYTNNVCFRFELYGCESTVTLENDWSG